ncbi:SLC13 family permease, partial [uncultured Planktosalinus sp.]|uniref:SLC13 family permease n=1 Tax=uncultured Planktosalinus sp. TaxID=1810935 RepID=UPI0030DA9DA8
SILGGMMTLIGTPPNIIISTFRKTEELGAFTMFDFAPVGIALTFAGLLFITLVGWRFLPKRQTEISTNNMFEIESYITEILINKESDLIGRSIKKIKSDIDPDIEILGIIRNDTRMHAPSTFEEIREHDILILESDTDDLKKFIEAPGLSLAEGEPIREKVKGGGEVKSIEAVITPNSPLIGKTISDFKLRSQYNVNVLAIARQNKKINKRISKEKLKPGDVFLLQGFELNIQELIKNLHCLPLAKRDIALGKPRRIIGALSIFVISIALVVTGVLSVDIAFSLAAVAMVLSKILPIKDVYYSVDWPVIILLAAMIPVGKAFETSGGAETVTQLLLQLGNDNPTWLFLGVLMLITMLLSNVINNAATVVLMAPVAIQVAQTFSMSSDPFLMTVAVGASSAFLTPIGHQSNTLVMSPGGYKFKDYLIMGIPVTLLILLLGVPLILYFWPV